MTSEIGKEPQFSLICGVRGMDLFSNNCFPVRWKRVNNPHNKETVFRSDRHIRVFEGGKIVLSVISSPTFVISRKLAKSFQWTDFLSILVNLLFQMISFITPFKVAGVLLFKPDQNLYIKLNLIELTIKSYQ